MFQSLESRVFDCLTILHDHKLHQIKLDSRSLICVLGYSPTEDGANIIILSIVSSLFLKMSPFTHMCLTHPSSSSEESMNDSDSKFDFLILIHNFSKTAESTSKPKLSPIVSEITSSHSLESTFSSISFPALFYVLQEPTP